MHKIYDIDVPDGVMLGFCCWGVCGSDIIGSNVGQGQRG